MPWERRKELHIDINASFGKVLMTSASDSSLLQPPPDYVAGDKMPIRVFFWERGPAGSLVAADPGPDTVLIYSAKPDGIEVDAQLLFLTDDFTEIETGVWEGTLDLATEDFQANLDAEPDGPKVIIGELEVRDSVADLSRASYQFKLNARPQVYNGTTAPLYFKSAFIRTADLGAPDVPQTLSIATGLTTDGTTPIPAAILQLVTGTATERLYTTSGGLFISPTGWQYSFTATFDTSMALSVYFDGELVAEFSTSPIVDLDITGTGMAPASPATGEPDLTLGDPLAAGWIGQLCRVGGYPTWSMYMAMETTPTATWIKLYP